MRVSVSHLKAKLTPVYPVLSELADLPFSMDQASRLLERLFDEPTLDLGCRYMLRRASVLHMENPRRRSPALLYAMLCVALYLEPPVLMHKGDCNSYRRHLFQVALNAIPSDLLPASPTVDIVITYLMLMNVCTCEYALHQHIPCWLDNAVFYARQLHLSAKKSDEKDEEKKEERRRYNYS
jgi:Fungal specific transcription factor domain